MISQILFVMLQIFKQFDVPTELSRNAVEMTKVMIAKDVSPSVILNIHYTLKINALEKNIDALRLKIQDLTDDLKALAERYSSLLLHTHLSEYRPELPSMNALKDDLKIILDRISEEGDSFTFFMVRLADLDEKQGTSNGLSLGPINEKRVQKFVDKFLNFMRRQFALRTNTNIEEDLPEAIVEDCMDQSDNSIVCVDSQGNAMDAEIGEEGEIVLPAGSIDIDFDDPTPTEQEALEQELLDAQALQIAKIYSSGVLSEQYVSEHTFSENHGIPHGDLEIMRNNAAQLLESIQVFDKYKAYRVGAESLVFVLDMPLEELNPALCDLMNFLESSRFLIDYSVAISHLNKKIYSDICRRRNVEEAVISIQHQEVYESLLDQLNSGISSLMKAKRQFTNRYIYERMKRDLERRALSHQNNTEANTKPITTRTRGGIQQIARDLAAQVESIKEPEEVLTTPTIYSLEPIQHNAPKFAVGRYISCGEDPFLANPTREESPLSAYSPRFLTENDLFADCIRLSEEQFLSDAGRYRKFSK